MPTRPLIQKPKGQRTLLVRARLVHQTIPGHPGPMVAAIHLQKEVRTTKGAMTLAGVRARVGMVFDRSLAGPDTSGGWRPTVEPHAVPAIPEYLQALAHGDLWPADEATAKALNGYEKLQGLKPVVFDPEYGGELKMLQDWLDERDEEAAPGNKKPAPAAPTTPPAAPAAPVVTAPPAPVKEGK